MLIILNSYEEFSQLKIKTKDSSSLKFYGLQILQNLTLNHLNDSNPTALIDVELKRFKICKKTMLFSKTQILYIIKH